MGYSVKKTLKVICKIAEQINAPVESIRTLSPQQVYYINHNLNIPTFLRACPGSGKTEVIGVKAAFSISQWKEKNGGVAVTTFTNSAAEQLNARIRKYADLTIGLYPHFIGTFDSFLHNFILQPHCHSYIGYQGKDGDKSIRIIDKDSKAGFISNYKAYVNYEGNNRSLLATEYNWDGVEEFEAITPNATLLFSQELSTDDKKSLIKCKMDFFRAGFATYSDAETLSQLILKEYPWLVEKLAKRFPILFVDECQDLSIPQLRILYALGRKGMKIHLVGDVNQSIYKFRKVDPSNLEKFVNLPKYPFKEMRLSNNFRSVPGIVSLSDKIMNIPVPNLSRVNGTIASPCILWQYDDSTFAELPQRFEQLLRENNLSIENSAILSRGRSTIQPLRNQDKIEYSKLAFFAYAIECWNKENRCTTDLKNALFFLGRSLCLLGYSGKGDPRNQFCPDFYTHIEWRLVLKELLEKTKELYPFEINGTDITWSQWSGKLKALLSGVWDGLRGVEEFSNIKTSLRAPSGKASSFVKELIEKGTGSYNNIRTTTIHSVKGESLDAVLLVSHKNKTSKGGHYSHWFREGAFDEEHIRFAYVACSRPKQLLVLATPKLNQEFLTKLQEIGFVYETPITASLF